MRAYCQNIQLLALVATLTSTLFLWTTAQSIHDLASPSSTLTPTPYPVTKMAYSYDPKLQYLYIQGGYNTTPINTPTDQFFALNLSQSWPADKPAWTNLGPNDSSRLNLFGLSGVVTGDARFLVNAKPDRGNNELHEYNGTSWSQFSNISMNTIGPLMVMDPKYRSIYFLGDGYKMRASANSTPLPFPSLKTEEGQAGLWSTKLSSVLRTFREKGTDSLVVQKCLTGRNPSWKTIGSAQNSFVSARYGHCFIPNSNGPELYLFGGITNSANKTVGDLHALDPTTGNWIYKATSLKPRAYMACAIAGNTFVIWGGIDENKKVVDSTPLLFDMTSGKWTTTFTNPSPTISLPNAPSSTTQSAAPVSSSNAAIIGGIVGGAALVALVAALLIIKKRGRKRDTQEMNTSRDIRSKSGKSRDSMDESGTGEQGSYKAIPSPFTTSEDGCNHDSVSHAKGALAHETTIPLAVRQPSFVNVPAHQERYPYHQPQQPCQAPFIAPAIDIENDMNAHILSLNQTLAHHSGPPPLLAPRPPSVLHPLSTSRLGLNGCSEQQPNINSEDDDDDHLSTTISRSMEPATVDLIPITASEAEDGNSVHSQSNSIASSQSMPAPQATQTNGRTATSNNKTRLPDEDEDDSEPLNYLDIN